MRRKGEPSEAELERRRKLGESAIHFTSESAREYQKLSAQKRRENRERRQSLQEIAKWLGNMAVNYNHLMEQDEILDLESSQAVNMTSNEAMMLAQYQKALAGDTNAAIFIRDTAGEKPKDEIEVRGMTMDEYAQKHKPKF